MRPKVLAFIGFLILILSLLSGQGYASSEKKIYVHVSIEFVDTDGDGLSDGMERDVHHTEPDNPDSDNDGYSDGAEIEYEGLPNDADHTPTKGDLVVISDPPGADVFLGGNWGYHGQFQGTTEAESGLLIRKLETGKYILRLSYQGYEDSRYEDSYTLVEVIPPRNISKTRLGVEVTNEAVQMKTLMQPDYREVVQLMSGGVPIDVGDASVPTVVDWDDDGRKDLLLGNSRGDLILYTNSGTDTSPIFTEGTPLMGADNFLAPFVVDWDNDWEKDLLIGTLDGNVLFFKNTGSDGIPDINGGEIVATMQNGYARPLVVDWDGDRKKDLVVGDGAGNIYLFMNTGSDKAPVLSPPEQTFVPILSLKQNGRVSPFVVTDWDGDGRKDIIVGTSDGLVLLYLNQGLNADGKETFENPVPMQAGSSETKLDIDAGNNASPFVVDWNGDGVKDLIIGNGDGRLFYYGDRSPLASISVMSDPNPGEGEEVLFNGSGSYDPDGDPLFFHWSFGDKSNDVEGINPRVSHTFVNEGAYTVTLTVTDTYGVSHSAKIIVNVTNEAPLVFAGFNQRVVAGDDVILSGQFIDPGINDSHSISWDFGDGTKYTGGLNTFHRFDTTKEEYTITLTVSDDGEGSSSASMTVIVDKPETVRPFSLTYPFSGMVFSRPSVNVSGKVNIASEGETVSINGIHVPVDDEGDFARDVDLAPGINTIAITLTDQDGYVYTERVAVNRSGGDINGDGIVDIADAFVVLQVSSGAGTPDSLGLDSGIMDVAPLQKDSEGNRVPNPDGVINVADALILLRAALGLVILPLP